MTHNARGSRGEEREKGTESGDGITKDPKAQQECTDAYKLNVFQK